MISEAQCRKILADDGQEMTDEEIRKIREFLYKTAEVIFELKEKTDGNKE